MPDATIPGTGAAPAAPTVEGTEPREGWPSLGDSLRRAAQALQDSLAAPAAALQDSLTAAQQALQDSLAAPAAAAQQALQDSLAAAAAGPPDRRPCDCVSCRTLRGETTVWNTVDDPHRRHAYLYGGAMHLNPGSPDPAAVRAWRGLRRQLTPAQWEAFVLVHEFPLRTRADARYRIRYEPSGNVYRDDGARFCLAHPSRYASLAMMLTVQVYLLLHDEAEFLRRANRLPDYLPPPVYPVATPPGTAPPTQPLAADPTGYAYTLRRRP